MAEKTDTGPESIRQPEVLPKIYATSQPHQLGTYAYALAADGHVLGSHLCSSEEFVPGDLGALPGYRPDRHATYAEHYPGGYEMEFVRQADAAAHAGLQAALAANHALCDPGPHDQ